ncbi:nucleotide exchange factor GrpE [Erythrobacter sp. SCSIO 43205]|uniref:nucleotide exchange factor GrpE n=1 Tax=Erythrobacter sp. SCSIO 43205 TaxID=2779361 RepID=UPI001CA8DA6B|nr:nucleotide exchange factor GrpE [Erythrobacter sp. SCSIO 43205]UAB77147.1 nucleotide exchange factor GrpE [Erythrobacter sp. SCSIO 43205]
MNDENKPQDDAAAEAELKGVPEEFLDGGDGNDEAEGEEAGKGGLAEALEALRGDLEAAKQDVLYAQAETQNVRRRMEKDVADARNYAATGFARDILSVWDNLSRAVEAIPDSLREDDKMKGLVVGIEATQRELEKVFKQHGVERIAAVGLPLDPNQHQAMMEVPSADHEAGTVIQEMQSGWMIKDRLLRPAMVGVAKKPD